MNLGHQSYPAERAGGVAARVYSGLRQRDGTTLVTVNGWPLNPRSNIRPESVTCFDWGYEGRGGPAQLALAILSDYFGSPRLALRHYETLTRRVIGRLPQNSWTLTGAAIRALFAEEEQ